MTIMRGILNKIYGAYDLVCFFRVCAGDFDVSDITGYIGWKVDDSDCSPDFGDVVDALSRHWEMRTMVMVVMGVVVLVFNTTIPGIVAVFTIFCEENYFLPDFI
jgi:hypothetical protein